MSLNLITDPAVMLKIRQKLKLNQSHFWGNLGVSQSAGSRYETGRSLPPDLAMLATIAYGTANQRTKVIESLTH